MSGSNTLSLDSNKLSVREINLAIRKAAQDGVGTVEIEHPMARHNLGVAITDPIHIVYKGDVGYYAVSLSDQVTAEIHGSAGWGIGDNLIRGRVIVHGNAATAAAPSLRGGTVVVKGSVGPRSAIGLKSGELIVGGNAGYMTGFFMQKGRLIICGDTGEALGDSMYQGAIYVGGKVPALGSGCRYVDIEAAERDELYATLDTYGIKAPKAFRKVESDRSLWHFDKKEFEVWKDVL
ncbi:MAG: glutamate synthase [Alphaproteobacteria bacterium]